MPAAVPLTLTDLASPTSRRARRRRTVVRRVRHDSVCGSRDDYLPGGMTGRPATLRTCSREDNAWVSGARPDIAAVGGRGVTAKARLTIRDQRWRRTGPHGGVGAWPGAGRGLSVVDAYPCAGTRAHRLGPESGGRAGGSRRRGVACSLRAVAGATSGSHYTGKSGCCDRRLHESLRRSCGLRHWLTVESRSMCSYGRIVESPWLMPRLTMRPGRRRMEVSPSGTQSCRDSGGNFWPVKPRRHIARRTDGEGPVRPRRERAGSTRAR
jgi:hypothetical protein